MPANICSGSTRVAPSGLLLVVWLDRFEFMPGTSPVTVMTYQFLSSSSVGLAALAWLPATRCDALNMGSALSHRTVTGSVGTVPLLFLLTPPSHLPSVAPRLSPAWLPGGNSKPFSSSPAGVSNVAPATLAHGELVRIRSTSPALHCELSLLQGLPPLRMAAEAARRIRSRMKH